MMSKSKSTAAMAVVVAMAAMSANAAQKNVGVSVPAGASVVPVSAISLPRLPSAQITSVKAVNAAVATPSFQGLQADARIQIITSQDAQSESAKPGALTAVFDNGSVQARAQSPVVAAYSASAAPLAPSAARTTASSSLSSIGYGSYNAANGGMVTDAFARFGRAIGALFSKLSKKANTPELSAEAYLADLKTRGEKMQNLVAGAAKTVSLLRMQVKSEAGKVAELSAKRDAALKAGKDDIAMSYDGQLAPLEATHASNKEQLAAAEQNLANAKTTLAEFVQKRESEFARVQAKLGEVKAKQAQAELQKLKNTMSMGSIESKDEFDQSVNDRIAEAEGQVEAGKATGQDEREEFERQMEKDAAKARLEQRKKDLGIGDAGTK